MSTETAHLAWNEEWQSDAGRAPWMDADGLVLEWGTRARLAGANTALDMGCGVGRHALALAKLGFNVTAFDAAPAGLAHVAKLAEPDDLPVTTVEGQMADLPFDDGAFDLVVSWNVVYHGDGTAVRRAVSELARVTRPGGTVVATMLSKRRADYGRGVEVSPDTFVQPDAGGDKSHPHFFVDAAGVTDVWRGFELLWLADVDEPGKSNWHWHLVGERVG